MALHTKSNYELERDRNYIRRPAKVFKQQIEKLKQKQLRRGLTIK